MDSPYHEYIVTFSHTQSLNLISLTECLKTISRAIHSIEKTRPGSRPVSEQNIFFVLEITLQNQATDKSFTNKQGREGGINGNILSSHQFTY